MLSATSQSQKDTHCVSHLYEVPRGLTFIETGSSRVGAWGWGTGTGSECFMGTECQSGKMRGSGDEGGDGCTAVGVHPMPLSCTPGNGYNGDFYVVCVL